jgi:hypothetical protein
MFFKLTATVYSLMKAMKEHNIISSFSDNVLDYKTATGMFRRLNTPPVIKSKWS